MKNFAFGLFLGLLLGVLGTAGVMTKRSSPVPRPLEVALPDKPVHAESDLSSFLEDHPYEIGFYARNLATGKTIERFADRSVCLASMIKVFCLTELYRQKLEAGLDLETMIDVPTHGSISLARAADLMIGLSDNPSTQALADFLGRDLVNQVPSRLGLDSMSDDILPDEETLRRTLDMRIFGERQAAAGLPQHGTARSMARFYELLLDGKVVSPPVSKELVAFFSRHPKPFSTHYAGRYSLAGKGGNILWTRPPKHYSMMGWSLFLTAPAGDTIVLCLWGEWFPETMPPEAQSLFLQFVTDCIISIVEGTKNPGPA